MKTLTICILLLSLVVTFSSCELAKAKTDLKNCESNLNQAKITEKSAKTKYDEALADLKKIGTPEVHSAIVNATLNEKIKAEAALVNATEENRKARDECEVKTAAFEQAKEKLNSTETQVSEEQEQEMLELESAKIDAEKSLKASNQTFENAKADLENLEKNYKQEIENFEKSKKAEEIVDAMKKSYESAKEEREAFESKCKEAKTKLESQSKTAKPRDADGMSGSSNLTKNVIVFALSILLSFSFAGLAY